MIKTLEEKTLFRGKVVKIIERTIKVGKRIIKREMVKQPNGISIVPVDKDGNVYLVKEFFVGAEKEIYALPGGKTDAETQNEFEKEAQRELREEIGMRAKKLIKLHATFSAPWFVKRKVTYFLGLDLVPDSLQTEDEDEVLEVVKMPLNEAIKKLENDYVTDAVTLGYLYIARDKLKNLDY